MSCLDVCYYAEQLEKYAQPKVHDFLSSDHAPVSLSLSIPVKTKPPRRKVRWHVPQADWQGFQDQLDQALFAATHRLSTGNLDKRVRHFTDIVLRAAKSNIPRGRGKGPCKSWWNERLQGLQTKYNATVSSMRTVSVDRKQALANMAQQQRKELHDEIRVAKREAWMQYCTSLSMSPQEHHESPFRVLRAMEGHRTKSEGQLLSALHPQARANTLAKHFAQVSRYEPHEYPTVRAARRQLHEPFLQAHAHVDVTAREVLLVSKRLAPKKSPGPNDIIPELAHKLTHQARVVLADIYASSISQSYIPRTWRTSTTVAIVKPNKDGTLPAHHCGISLLCVFYKGLEHIVKQQLKSYFAVLPPSQFGFRPGADTSHATARILHSIGEHLDQPVPERCHGRCKAAVLSLDFQAAFDKVCIELLGTKLLR
eukprot:5979278-Amphidinium_carterae.1